MNLLVINFKDPVKKRIEWWLSEQSANFCFADVQETGVISPQIQKQQRDFILLDLDHTENMNSVLQHLKKVFPHSRLVGITASPHPYLKKNLPEAGLNALFTIDELLSGGLANLADENRSLL